MLSLVRKRLYVDSHSAVHSLELTIAASRGLEALVYLDCGIDVTIEAWQRILDAHVFQHRLERDVLAHLAYTNLPQAIRSGQE